MGFDIVIPTLHIDRAAALVKNMKMTAEYAHNYYVIDNGDNPEGYVKPCNKGFRAGESHFVFFVNDDLVVHTDGWDRLLAEPVLVNGATLVCPTIPNEKNMKLNGWFLGIDRVWAERFGWAFDPRFVVWCGDVDLMKRLEREGGRCTWVEGLDIDHKYSQTCEEEALQAWINPLQLYDLDAYQAKWGSSANHDKLVGN